jgi:hypothetical protein
MARCGGRGSGKRIERVSLVSLAVREDLRQCRFCAKALGDLRVSAGACGPQFNLFQRMSKSAFIPGVPAKSESDFEVSASTRLAGYRRFFGVLRVVRKTDGKVLFPFDGAGEIGPFVTRIEALAAAQVYGEHIVGADLVNPEL